MLLLNAITGFSGSLSLRNNLHSFLDDIVGNSPEIKKNYLFSSSKTCVEDSIQFLYKNKKKDDNILLIGKSLGGIRTWWIIYKYFVNLKNLLVNDTKLSVILLDPHGWQSGDGHTGSYGINNNILPEKEEWALYESIDITCIYQRNKYPKGAHFNNFNNIKLGSTADHWNIENIETPTGKLVAEYIDKTIKTLTGV